MAPPSPPSDETETETDGSDVSSCSDIGEYDDDDDDDDDDDKEEEEEEEDTDTDGGALLLDAAARGDAVEVTRLLLGELDVVVGRSDGDDDVVGCTAAAATTTSLVIRDMKRTPEGETALALAVRFGHAACARVMLRAPGGGPELARCKNLNDNTSLHRAVAGGDLESCRVLLEGGADPLAAGSLGSTPLHLAVDVDKWRRRWWRRHRYGEKEEEEEKGKEKPDEEEEDDGDDDDDDGESIADEKRWAAARLRPKPSTMTDGRRAQRMRVAHLLIDAAAKAAASAAAAAAASSSSKEGRMDPRDRFGRTPLMEAASSGFECAVKALLAAGADPRLKDDDDETALHKAAELGRAAAANALLESPACDPSARESEGDTPLMIASRHGSAEIARALCERPFVLVDKSNHAGLTPLMAAAGAGHADVVEELLSRGADVNKVDVSRRNAVHYAAESGRANVVRMLLAPPDAAASASSASASALSINDVTSPFRQRGGFDLDIRRRTPLLLAARRGHVAVIQALLSRCGDGVNPLCHPDDEVGREQVGDTFDGGLIAARRYCDERGFDAAVAESALGGAGAGADRTRAPTDHNENDEGSTYDSGDEGAAQPHLRSRSRSHSRHVDTTTTTTATPTVRIAARDTPLVNLPIFNFLRMLALEEEDDAGMTPLLAAVERGHRDAAALLLVHGADIDATDHSGRGVKDFPQCPREVLESFSALWNLGEDDTDETEVSFAWEAPWCPRLHWMWPRSFRRAVRTLLMCSRHGRTATRRGDDDDDDDDGEQKAEHSGMVEEENGEAEKEENEEKKAEKEEEENEEEKEEDTSGGDAGETPPPLVWLDEQCLQLIIRHMSRPVGVWVRADDVATPTTNPR